MAAVTAYSVGDSGTRIISGSDDTSVRVWDPAAKLGNAFKIFWGHRGMITALATTKDAEGNARVISGSRDRTVRMWDLREAGDALSVMSGHEKQIESLAAYIAKLK